MKNIVILIFAILFFSAKLEGQPSPCSCQWNFEIEQNPNDLCEFFISFCADDLNNCTVLDYNQITIENFDQISPVGVISAENINTSISTPSWTSQSLVFGTISGVTFNSLAQSCVQGNPKVQLGKFRIGNVQSNSIQFALELSFLGNFECRAIQSPVFDILCSPAPIATFEKIYGNDKDNHPTGVKAFGDGIYVPGVRFQGGEEWGTFTKFDLSTGDLVWQKNFSRPLKVNDFEYVSEEDAFILIGHLTPFQNMSGPQDNQSFIMKVDDTGDIVKSKIYFRNGREGFNRILRHSNPLNPAFPYYVLGNQNPTATVNGDDQITLFNFNDDLIYNWGREYKYRVTIDGDDEFHRGLIEIPNGDIAMAGNDIIDNDGIVVRVNGMDGSVSESSRTNTGKIDFYDGIVFNDIAFLVGEYFETGESFIVNGAGHGMRLTDIDRFTDIWTDGNGNLFTIGNNKNPLKGGEFPVVCKFSFFGGEITFENAFYLEDDEIEFGEGYINVTPEHDRIFYADARKTDAFGTDNFDMLVGSFDFLGSSDCKTYFDPAIRSFDFPSLAINVTSVGISEPNSLSNNLADLFENNSCVEFCQPPCDDEEAPELYKLYGDDLRGSITKMEYYQGDIYALGLRGSTNTDYQGFLMKLNLAGEIQWTALFPQGQVMNDFSPTATGFILIGDTRPIDINTNSIIAKINLDGTLGWARNYDFDMRERPIRIAPANDAANPALPSQTSVLILGYVGNGFDDQILLNIDENGTEIFRREYDSGSDDQAHSAFRRLSNGTHLSSGQWGTNGQLGFWDVTGGTALYGTEGGAGTRLLDIAEANNKVYVVGTDGSDGYILVLENDGTTRVSQYTLPQISRINRIRTDAAGNLYLLTKGDIGDGNANRNLIYKVKERSTQQDQSNLDIRWVKYINHGGTNFTNGSILVADDRFIFQEGRLNDPVGFGDYDDAIGFFNLDMSGECVECVDGHTIAGVSITTQISSPYNVTNLAFPPSTKFNLPDSLAFEMVDLACGDTCYLDFTVQADSIFCTEYQFTSIITQGTAPFTYEWDFGCDGTIESNDPNPIYDFSSGGTYSYCLTVTDADCAKNYTGSILIKGDTEPPIITCVQPDPVNTDAGTCLAEVIPDVTATDECSQFSITCVTADGQDCPNLFEKGDTELIYTSTDLWGNTSSCSITVTVIDAEFANMSCNRGVTVVVDQNCEATITPDMIDGGSTDNCEIVSRSVNPRVISSDLGCETVPVVLRIVDCGGNISNCTSLVNVVDGSPPEINCPPNVVISADGNKDDFSLTGIPTVTDNCIFHLDMNPIDVMTQECPPANVFERTWSASDECQNVSTCVQLIEQECDTARRNCGEAVVTCFPSLLNNSTQQELDPLAPVMGIVDIRDRSSVPANGYWANASGSNIYHPTAPNQAWNYNNLGLVFGLAIDSDNNIYTSSSTIYGCDILGTSPFGPSDNSRIYKIDFYNNISVLVEEGTFDPSGNDIFIPSGNAGFGNICYDSEHHQLFATNFSDGMIYRIDLASGKVKERFDPFSTLNNPSSDNSDFVELGERTWGVGYYSNRLYFSRWTEHRQLRDANENNEIWSIGLNSSGGFSAVNCTSNTCIDGEILEIVLPNHRDVDGNNYTGIQNYSNPVSDIAFSSFGRMLLSEKTMGSDCGSINNFTGNYNYAHNARVLEYEFSSAWQLTSGYNPPLINGSSDLKFQLNMQNFIGQNASGGIDYGYSSFDPNNPNLIPGCDSMVWASSDNMRWVSGLYYGIMGMPSSGGGNYNSIKVDFDGITIPGDGTDKWLQGDVEIFKCFDCPKDTCQVSFTWETDCYDLQATPTYSGFNGTPDVTWRLDGVPFDPNHTFSAPGTYEVCAIATDGNCTNEYCADVVVNLDTEDPVIIDCPSGQITLPTDPGICSATFGLTAEDNCDDDPLITYILAGIGNGTFTTPTVQLNLGITVVSAIATDDAGNDSPLCIFRVLVDDREPPQITCPDEVNKTIPGCQRGVNIDFGEPQVSDNCPDVIYVCDYQSNAFFFCGITTVSCTATDGSGNTSSCSFDVEVICTCAQILSSTIECGDEPDTYNFTVEVENQTGSGNPCDFGVSMPATQGQLIVSNTTWNTGNTIGTITGEIIPVIPISSSFDLVIDALCVCPRRDSFECTLPVSLTPICCKEAYLEGKEVCSEDDEFPVEVTFGGVINNVTQVDWYLSYESCDAPVWQHYATSFDVTTDVFPPYLDMPTGDNDFCIYAVATVGDFPCSTITSDIAEFILCDPVGCSLPSQEFCYTGVPITPSPLVLSIDNTDCQYEIEWFDADGNIISGQTGQTTYQPPTLDWTLSPDDCKQEFSFSAQIVSVCGIQVCTSTIAFYNDDAPVGIITMDPLESLPFCPGEDATLTFEPECPMPPPAPEWKWFSGSMQNNLTEVTGAGDTNPLIHTNRLWADTWFGVETQNGTCDPDMSTFFIDVYDRLAINLFEIRELDPCRENGVKLILDYAPTDCPVDIDWYKDGVIIHTGMYSSTSAEFDYQSSPSGFAGNYYAIVKSTCCPEEIVKSQVEVFALPIELVLAAPCFRCNDEPFEVVAQVLNEDNNNCTFKWYRQIGLGAPTLLSETSNVLSTNSDDEFMVLVDCNGCQKTATFQVNQCGYSSTEEPTLDLSLGLYPNPTDATVFLSGKEPFGSNFRIEILDFTGHKMEEIEIPVGQSTIEFSIGDFAAGVYMVRVSEFGRFAWSGRIIKQ